MSQILELITNPTPPVANLISLIGTIVSLFLTQNLIDNKTAQLVTGLASVVIPAAFAIGVAILTGHKKQAAARIEAAHIVKAPAVKTRALPVRTPGAAK